MTDKVRLDRYLFAVRLFKTRTLAAEICKKDRVLINNIPAKASKMICLGEKIEIKYPPILRSFIVTGLIEKRVSAKLAPEFVKEITPDEEKIKLKTLKEGVPLRPRGTGRPTKKERRIIDGLNNYTD